MSVSCGGTQPSSLAGLLAVVSHWGVDTARRKPLQFEDIWELPEGDKVENITARFEHHWAEEMRKRKPSLVRSSRPSHRL